MSNFPLMPLADNLPDWLNGSLSEDQFYQKNLVCKAQLAFLGLFLSNLIYVLLVLYIRILQVIGHGMSTYFGILL